MRYPPVAIRPNAELHQELDARGHLGQTLKRDAIRYYHLLRLSLPTLTPAEARDCFTLYERGRLDPSHVTAVLNRRLSPAQYMALTDALERISRMIDLDGTTLNDAITETRITA